MRAFTLNKHQTSPFCMLNNTSQVSVVGERGRVNSKGVILESGEVMEADVVVCNADLPYAEKALLPDTVSRPFEVRVRLCGRRRR